MNARRGISLVLGSGCIAAMGIMPLATSASAEVSCPMTPDRDAWVLEAGAFLKNSNIRQGPSTECTSNGVGRAAHMVVYLCYEYNEEDEYTWTYLKDLTTGVEGWTRDDLLEDYGSTSPCSQDDITELDVPLELEEAKTE
jgi:hypothetical protein